MPDSPEKVAATHRFLRANSDLMEENKEHFSTTSVRFVFDAPGSDKNIEGLVEVDSEKVTSLVFGEETLTEAGESEVTEFAKNDTERFIRFLLARQLAETWLNVTDEQQKQYLPSPQDYDAVLDLADSDFLRKIVVVARQFAGHFYKNSFITTIDEDVQTTGSIAVAVGLRQVAEQLKFVGELIAERTNDDKWLDPEFLTSSRKSPLQLNKEGYPIFVDAWLTNDPKTFETTTNTELAESALHELDILGDDSQAA